MSDYRQTHKTVQEKKLETLPLFSIVWLCVYISLFFFCYCYFSYFKSTSVRFRSIKSCINH